MATITKKAPEIKNTVIKQNISGKDARGSINLRKVVKKNGTRNGPKEMNKNKKRKPVKKK